MFEWNEKVDGFLFGGSVGWTPCCISLCIRSSITEFVFFLFFLLAGDETLTTWGAFVGIGFKTVAYFFLTTYHVSFRRTSLSLSFLRKRETVKPTIRYVLGFI